MLRHSPASPSGVGSIQVTPYQCNACDASQFMPNQRSEFAEESRLGWWVGCHHDDRAQSIAVFAMCHAHALDEATAPAEPAPAPAAPPTPNIDWPL